MVDRNSAPEEFTCIWQSKRVGIITIETKKMWIHFSCDIFVAVSCRGILNSLIFTKAWSMQGWTPVVSSSLYFWKIIFNFWVDSILKWRVCIKVKVSWLRAFLWCMSLTSHDQVNSLSCTNSRKELRRCCSLIGHNNTKHFLCPIRSQHLLDCLEMVQWESETRGFSACAWKLLSCLFSRCDWPPLGLPGWFCLRLWANFLPINSLAHPAWWPEFQPSPWVARRMSESTSH